MTPEQALHALDGDGIMWRVETKIPKYWLRDSHTQDTVRVPNETAEAIIPQLRHSTRFGQDRWFRPTLEYWQKMLGEVTL